MLEDFEHQDSFKIIRTILIQGLKNFDRCLEELQDIKDMECVIVGSGDGTIVAVLNALKDRDDIVYGFLPLGTSNTFVRSLGLPLQYPAARDVVLKQHLRPTPLGSVNGVLFANIAGIGVPVRVTVKTSTNPLKRLFGPATYVLHAVRAIVSYKAFLCHVSNDDISESFYTHHIILANGPYHGPLRINKDLTLFDNQLVLIALGVSDSRVRYLRSILSLLLRRHESDPHVRVIPLTKAFISTRPSRGIQADGEMISRTPATIEIVKDAIRVFTPPPAPKSDKRRKHRH